MSSLSSAPQETELLIEAITVNLTKAYVKSRLECVHAVMDGEVDGKNLLPLCSSAIYETILSIVD